MGDQRLPGRDDVQRLTGKGIACVAVSSLSARQDDADDEAADAALDMRSRTRSRSGFHRCALEAGGAADSDAAARDAKLAVFYCASEQHERAAKMCARRVMRSRNCWR